MYAVIRTGGKQYTVKEGDTLKIERLEAEPGKPVEFEVLLVGDDAGKEVKIGAPTVAGAKVTGKVKTHGRGKKVEIVKYKPKSRYKRTTGHRQPFTEVTIEKISA